MENYEIIIPSHLLFNETLIFIDSFKDLRLVRNYVFDFKNLRRIDPFSLLCLSSEMQLFKHNNPNCTFSAKNYEHRTYEAHMGFFQSFGLKYGKLPGEANNNNNYIPITLYNVQEIKNSARDLLIPPGEYLTDRANEISEILTRGSSAELKEVLTYCIREIFRNIVEHSQSSMFGFCAQYLPTMNKVIFAVLDRGIGINNSISQNPKLNIENDLQAIYESLKPGISGKVYSGQKNKPKGDWANSGYGLFMTSNICRKGGSFFIASNSKGILQSLNSTKEFDLNIVGTGLILTIDTNQISNLKTMLSELREVVPITTKIKASKSSMNFS
jgi:hypothetical protein